MFRHGEEITSRNTFPRSSPTTQYFTALFYILRLLKPRFPCQNSSCFSLPRDTVSVVKVEPRFARFYRVEDRGHPEALCNSIPFIEFSLLWVVCTGTFQSGGKRNRFHRVSRGNFFSPFLRGKVQIFGVEILINFVIHFFEGYFLLNIEERNLERLKLGLKSNFNFEIWRDAIEIVISELILSGIMRNLEDLELEISQNLLNINQNIYSLYFSLTFTILKNNIISYE